jgi:hypothetical protein
MKIKQSIFWIVMLAVSAFAVGCDTNLKFENDNGPNTDQVLASPDDVESLIAGAFLVYWGAHHANYEPGMGFSTVADQQTASWGNFGMQDLSSEPRRAWDNSPSYTYDEHNVEPWFRLYRAVSNVNDALVQLDKGLDLGDATRNARARAWGKFVQGLAHGYLALMFDKAFIFDESVDLSVETPQLVGYNEMMTAAITMLEEAASIASANAFEVDGWVNGLTLSNDDVSKLAYSYAARYMAQVGRTPAERDAADWTKIANYASMGITADFAPQGDGNFWWMGLHYLGSQHIWTRADYKTIGVLDQSGGYTNWLNTAVADRMPFELDTPDRRITDGTPQGAGTDFTFKGAPSHRPDRGTYHFSYYHWSRRIEHLNSGATTEMPTMLVAEMDLLRAESALRANDGGTAAGLINTTRVGRGQLAALTGAESSDDLWAALRYEKRVECYHTGPGGGYFDARGWGLLVKDTPIHFPIPGSELETLQLTIYTFGGGGEGSAAKVVMPEAAKAETLQEAMSNLSSEGRL